MGEEEAVDEELAVVDSQWCESDSFSIAAVDSPPPLDRQRIVI